MDSELKPCPFCGGGPRLYPPTCNRLTPYDPSHRAFPVVRCSCGAEIAGNDWEESGKSAIAKWNRRALEQHEAVPTVLAWDEKLSCFVATPPRDVPEAAAEVQPDGSIRWLRDANGNGPSRNIFTNGGFYPMPWPAGTKLIAAAPADAGEVDRG